jgi:phage terminase large subunit-like protein
MATYKISGRMLKPYQLNILKQLWNGDKQHFIGALPRKAGKSVLALYTANAFICGNYPEIFHIIILAKEKAQVKEIYEKNLLENGKPLMSILPPSARYIPYQSEIVYANGSTIKFHGADDVENIRGGRYDMIIGDEMATWKKGAIDVLIPCLRDINKSILFLISTVRGKNEYYQLMETYKNNPKWIVMKETVFSLGLMTQQEYDDYPMEVNMKRQELLNDVDSAFIGAIYATPNIGSNIYVKSYPVYIAVDLGDSDDATAILLCQVINNKINIFHSVEYISENTDEEIADILRILREYEIPLAQCIMFLPHDGNRVNKLDGRSRKSHYSQVGLECRTVPNCKVGVMDGIQMVRYAWINIIFDEIGCGGMNGAIERIKSYIKDDNDRPKHDKSSHIADALRYLIIGLETEMIITSWRGRNQIASSYLGMESFKIDPPQQQLKYNIEGWF